MQLKGLRKSGCKCSRKAAQTIGFLIFTVILIFGIFLLLWFVFSKRKQKKMIEYSLSL